MDIPATTGSAVVEQGTHLYYNLRPQPLMFYCGDSDTEISDSEDEDDDVIMRTTESHVDASPTSEWRYPVFQRISWDQVLDNFPRGRHFSCVRTLLLTTCTSLLGIALSDAKYNQIRSSRCLPPASVALQQARFKTWK